MADQTRGIFGDFGFPDLSEDDIIKQRTQQAQDAFQEKINTAASFVRPNDRLMFTTFAQLGKGLTEKLQGNGAAALTGKEKQQFAIMAKSNENIGKLQKTEKYKNADQREKALLTQEAIANSALEMGDSAMFADVMLRSATQRAAFKKADKDIENIDSGIETDATTRDTNRARTDGLKFGNRLAKLGETSTFALPNENGDYDFTSAPELVIGRRDPFTGKVKTTDGRELPASAISANDFDTFQDNVIAGAKAAGTAGGAAKNRTSFLTNYSATERRGAREAAATFEKIGETVQTVAGQFQDAFKRGDSAESIVGNAGALIKFADNAFKTVRGALTSFTPQMTVGGTENADGSIQGGEVKSFEESVEILGERISLPGDVEEDSLEAQKYRSSVMRLVYMDARLQEPGARQLSDADIKNAMDRLGVNSNNPEAIAQVLMQNIAASAGALKSSRAQVRGVGAASGLTPDNAEMLVFGRKNMDKVIDKIQNTVFESFGDQGTAGEEQDTGNDSLVTDTTEDTSSQVEPVDLADPLSPEAVSKRTQSIIDNL